MGDKKKEEIFCGSCGIGESFIGHTKFKDGKYYCYSCAVEKTQLAIKKMRGKK